MYRMIGKNILARIRKPVVLQSTWQMPQVRVILDVTSLTTKFVHATLLATERIIDERLGTLNRQPCVVPGIAMYVRKTGKSGFQLQAGVRT